MIKHEYNTIKFNLCQSPVSPNIPFFFSETINNEKVKIPKMNKIIFKIITNSSINKA